MRASRLGSPLSSTRPGCAAARTGGSGAGERRRTRYGANVAGGIETRCGPAGASTAPQARIRSGRPASRSATLASARIRSGALPSVPSRSPQRPAIRPSRRTSSIGTPAPVISRMPTARRWRSTPDAPSGNAARRISSRNVRPRSGSGSSTRPSGATSTGGLCRPSAATRTSVGRRTVSPAGSSRSSRTVARRGAVHSSQAVRPSSQEPIHGRGEESNALDARKPGRPSNRPEDSKPRGPPTSASMAESSARASTVPHPSAVHERAAGGAICRSSPRSPSWRSRTSSAPAVPRRGSRRNGSSPAVRSNR